MAGPSRKHSNSAAGFIPCVLPACVAGSFYALLLALHLQLLTSVIFRSDQAVLAIGLLWVAHAGLFAAASLLVFKRGKE